MSAGRKLGYAAAIAVGLLLATAWAVSAQNPCAPDYGSWGLRFVPNCDNPSQAIRTLSDAEQACNNMYTQGFWSHPTEAAGSHAEQEAKAIRDGLSTWSGATAGDITWEFDAGTEEVIMPWGYEDRATIDHSIATLDNDIDRIEFAIQVEGGDSLLLANLTNSKAAREALDHIQVGSNVRIPYYTDLPDWVDKPGAAPPSFDPADPTYSHILDPEPKWLGNNVGHFVPRPVWDPTLTPGLEILKCEGRSTTEIVGTPTIHDDGGVVCSHSGWNAAGIDYANAECIFTQPKRWAYVDPPGTWYQYTPTTTAPWQCGTTDQTIKIGSDDITRTLSGFTTPTAGGYTCGYTFPQNVLKNYSKQQDDINADPALSPTTIGHDILDRTTFRTSTTPTGWGVRYTEHARARWEPRQPCEIGESGNNVNKPCWPTFNPDVRMSPRLDQLLVGTPTWVWMDNVSRSCLPSTAAVPVTPPPPASDCDRPSIWKIWPTDETDPNTWRHEKIHTEAGNIVRAAFPQKISIELTPTGGGARSTYECWTDDNGGLRIVADGAWAPGRRPFASHPVLGVGPLASPNGPLNPGVGDCTFVHTTAGPHTATITIHWIGKVGYSYPGGNLVWTDPDPALGDDPPPPTVQTGVNLIFHELHVTPGS